MPMASIKVRAVLFDLDETLIEEEASNDASALAACAIAQARHGADPGALLTALRKCSSELFLAGPMIDYCRDIGISSREALWGSFSAGDSALAPLRQWIPEYRLRAWSGALREAGIDDRALAAELAQYSASDRKERHVVFPESVRILQHLKRDFRLGLITNGAPDIQGEKIRGANLGGYFDATVISGEVGFGKPNPKIFRLVLERLTVAPHEAVMVGDSLSRDVAGAHHLGIKTIWVNRFNRTIIDRVAAPDLELTDLGELPTLLTHPD
jgi:putative hydrolase of the HAD superfamily